MSVQNYCPSSYESCISSPVGFADLESFQSPIVEIPALAGTLVRLELLLQQRTVDLEAITRLVRSDLGLTIQALRHSRSRTVAEDDLWRISDCVIYLGPKLLGLTQPLCCWTDSRKHWYLEAQAFWKHARLVAAAAEATATYFRNLDVNPEQAYIAGLMHNLERLPQVLANVGYATSDCTPCTIQELSTEWNLPCFINDVLKTVNKDFAPDEMDALSRVVSFARGWIDLCLPWSETCGARKSRFKVPVLRTADLICEFFLNTETDPLVPFMGLLRDSTMENLEEQQ